MKHLFVTALAATLGMTAAQAQTTTAPAATDATEAHAMAISPPEGYVEGDVVLTSDNLEGASVYDANGDDIGKIHGFVFASGASSLMNSTALTAPGTDTAMSPDATRATGSTDAADTATTTDHTSGKPESTTGVADQAAANSDTAASNGSATATGSSADGNAAASGDSSSATAPDSVSGEKASTTLTVNKDAASDAATTDAATTPPASTGATTDAGAMENGEISHAIIDVGGFLGIGTHRVAVPVDDLVIYQKDDDIRIYLPWTREQLEALPEFDENDPATVTRQNRG